MNKVQTADIDRIIVGRVEPHIYAFTTETVPNYLKVGDTYRPVEVRLNEWRFFYPELVQCYQHVAKTKNEKYYRDFAVHYYLENIKQLHRLQKGELKNIPYYSKEFFEKAQPSDIDEAIMDIEHYASQVGSPYQFYTEDHLPTVEHYARLDSYDPRPNQQETINNFVSAIKAGRNNLLMYAVMRFGKSFTSMCCATEMQAKVVLVVSAKADVREEWKKTVESHMRFEDYDFLESEDLLCDEEAITNRLNNRRCVVVFLTLQDLVGDDIKQKHQDLFQQTIDLLIVDETHFGARAAEYGKILLNSGLTKSQVSKELQSSDDNWDALDEGLAQIKSLKVRCKLHLSGTPYRILMGSEFTKQDIIAFYQFTDIIDAKEVWDKEHLDTENPDTHHVYEEWDNPYYGFPQMIRFAFNPSASARQLIDSLKENGKTAALNELFRPQSVTRKADGSHRKFVHEDEVLELIQVIDGSREDDGLLGFLDYDKLKDGKMCRHIVCVLPFCASCDAFEELLKQNKSTFKNLQEYEIINISGVDAPSRENKEIKRLIKDYERQGKKTLSLTVNRMLTGSTVPEWDTMLFLKDVSSPQEYDQAIFRLQNQYVKKYTSNEGDMYYNMKPQTLLVDFDVSRMFRMQEQKSMIYNVNSAERGNDQLQERIARELEISPIIVLNKDKLVEATPANIMDAVREYSATRTLLDEATDIPADAQLLTDPCILGLLENISPISNNKGIDIKPVDGEQTEIDFPTDDILFNDSGEQQKETTNQNTTDEDDKKWDKRLATYYSQILFYAMLTDSKVHSLHEVIEDIPLSENNQRIANHVGLQLPVLQYLSKRINPFILSKLDYKIENINDLMRDESLLPFDRVELALRKFGRLSDSEVVTPAAIIGKMLDQIPSKLINDQSLFLDVAAKEGEFACALYKRYGEQVKNNIYAIPTSALTYELTRRVYGLLGMPLDHVLEGITSYELNEKNKEKIQQILHNMKFDVVLGNPPYVGKGDPLYMQIAKEVYDNHLREEGVMNLIHPTALVENKYTGNASYESLKKKYQDIKIQNFYYDPKLRDAFGAMIGNGIAVFSYSIQGKTSLFDEELKRQRFVDYDKDKAIIDAISSKRMIGSCQDFFGFHGGQADIIKNVENHLGTGYYVVMAYNRGHIDEKTGGHIWDWTTLQSEEYLTIQNQPPYIAQNTIRFDSYEEAKTFVKWTTTDFVSFIVLYYKYFMTNNPSLFNLIPMPPTTDDFSNKALSQYFNLTLDQLTYIHNKVKNFGWKVYYKCTEDEVLKKIDDKNEGRY